MNEGMNDHLIWNLVDEVGRGKEKGWEDMLCGSIKWVREVMSLSTQLYLFHPSLPETTTKQSKQTMSDKELKEEEEDYLCIFLWS